MFSLCIPTINRYDEFLSKYIPNYINNPLIDEIIISDENGQDADKINKNHKHPKLKVLINSQVLGPFLNKYNCCKHAKNEWIAIIDSDNFADDNYFQTAKQYILNNIPPDNKNIILAPDFAQPNFNYTHLSGKILQKNTLLPIRNYEQSIKKTSQNSEVLMNTGNYIINKYNIQNIDLSKEQDNIQHSSACDVIYFNTLLFEQLDTKIHVVPNLQYSHVVHKGSVYTNTRHQTASFINYVHNRFYNLRNNNEHI